MYQKGSVVYVYPYWKRVSFGLIAEKHVSELKKYLKVSSLDETAFPHISLVTNPLLILQPYFYPFQNHEREIATKIQKNIWKIKGIIGIDVADSDHITDYAVHLTNYSLAMIVPSQFSKKVYVDSGVKVPVYVVPHGIDESFITAPARSPITFPILARLKETKKLKVITSWILHSPFRKGRDILLKFFGELLKYRKDVVLVLKTFDRLHYFFKDNFDRINYSFEKENLAGEEIERGWLSEGDKRELFDLTDLYALTSRGGGFEHPALEALSRGVPTIAGEGGSWSDFIPSWLLVKSYKSGKVFEDNPIHDGFGIEMDVNKAVDKALDILDNLEEYKERVREYALTYVKENYNWVRIGTLLKDIILKYL